MSRLNKYERDSIRRAVMSDVPEVDYASQMQSRGQAVAVEALPPEIRRIWANGKLRGYVKSFRIYLDCMSITVPGADDDGLSNRIKSDPELVRLHELHDAQRETRQQLDRKLRYGFASISTTKQFAERFPELVKYLPAENQPVANLPASTDVMDALKAAGLPTEEGR